MDFKLLKLGNEDALLSASGTKPSDVDDVYVGRE